MEQMQSFHEIRSDGAKLGAAECFDRAGAGMMDEARSRRLMKFQELIGIANFLQVLALARAALAAK